MHSRRTHYPSIESVLSQHGYGHPELMRLPPQRRYQHQRHSYSRAQSSRMYERDDPTMRTIDTRSEASTVDGPMPAIREEPCVEAPANLNEALHPVKKGRSRARRISLTTLVVDLALVVRRSLQKLRLAQEKGRDANEAEV